MKINPATSSQARPSSQGVSAATTKKATTIVKDQLDKKLGAAGVVKLLGKVQLKPTGKPGIYQVSGKVDVNALWGGDEKRSFSGLVDINKGTLTNLKTHVVSVDN
jgi:hypothetical protein